MKILEPINQKNVLGFGDSDQGDDPCRPSLTTTTRHRSRGSDREALHERFDGLLHSAAALNPDGYRGVTPGSTSVFSNGAMREQGMG